MGQSIPFKYPGQRSKVTMPDTLDLADNAALAINGFVGITDRDMDSLNVLGRYVMDLIDGRYA